jgi:Membrane-associated sensor, integral membrane domain
MPIFVVVEIMARNETNAGGALLVDLPPTARQTWSAVTVVAALLVGFAAVAAFAGTPLSELNAFFPSLDAIVFVTDLVTSVLLFTQFWIFHSRPLLALANGYLFTAAIVVPHALTFSGAFSPTGLLGASAQTGSWLFIFWHIGFAAALLAYTVLRDEEPAKSFSDASAPRAIGWSVACVLGLVCGLAWLATGGVTLLPALVVDGTYISPLASYLVAFTILVSVTDSSYCRCVAAQCLICGLWS